MRITAGRAALTIEDELIDLYRAVFTAPPWNEADEDVEDFRRRLRTDVDRPGFRAVLADGAGFATSWTTTLPLPDVRAYQRIAVCLGPTRLAELAGACEVDELAVAQRARGEGLGRRLLDAATAGADRAWLVTSTDAPDAVAFYRHLGWQAVEPACDPDELVVFVRARRDDPGKLGV